MHIERPTFPFLLNEVDGIFANARIAYSLTLVDRAMSHGEWARAIELLGALADKIADKEIPPAGFEELLLAASWCALRMGARANQHESDPHEFTREDNLAALNALFARHATRAWPRPKLTVVDDQASFIAQKRAQLPWNFARIFADADRPGFYRRTVALAELLEQYFPDFPLAIYTAAHAQERRFREREHAPSEPKSSALKSNESTSCLAPHEIAQRFVRAAELADALDLPQFAQRARLRAGVLFFYSGENIQEDDAVNIEYQQARDLLRQVDPKRLSPANQLWYAVGMAHSSFWLDRVRAADRIIAVDTAAKLEASRMDMGIDNIENSDIPAHSNHSRALQAAIRYLLAISPRQLAPLETDRSLELIELLAEASDQAMLQNELKLRRHIDTLIDLPLSRAGEAARIMQPADEGATRDQAALPAPGQAAAQFCRAVEAIAKNTPDARPGRATLDEIEAYYPLGGVVLSILWAIHTANPKSLATALGSLEGKLRLQNIAPDDLKPLGLIWPPLLELLGQFDAQSDSADPTTLKRIHQSSIEILERWVPDAPQPSYGWWRLSADLFAHPTLKTPWPTYAVQCVERALADPLAVNEDEAGDELKSYVLQELLYRAARHAPDEELLNWLARLA